MNITTSDTFQRAAAACAALVGGAVLAFTPIGDVAQDVIAEHQDKYQYGAFQSPDYGFGSPPRDPSVEAASQATEVDATPVAQVSPAKVTGPPSPRSATKAARASRISHAGRKSADRHHRRAHPKNKARNTHANSHAARSNQTQQRRSTTVAARTDEPVSNGNGNGNGNGHGNAGNAGSGHGNAGSGHGNGHGNGNGKANKGRSGNNGGGDREHGQGNGKSNGNGHGNAGNGNGHSNGNSNGGKGPHK